MANTEAQTVETQARRLENVNAELADLMRRPGVAQRLRAAGRDEWSAVQVVGHLIEMIPYWMADARTIAAAGEPPHFGRSLEAPERLEGPRHGATGEPEALLTQLDDEIRAAARDMRALSPAQLAKKGIHVRAGEMTVADIVERLIVKHAEEHLAQIKAALEAQA